MQAENTKAEKTKRPKTKQTMMHLTTGNRTGQ